MNIRDNIVNYLFDKNYVICIYENNVYIYRIKHLISFSNKRIVCEVEDRKITIIGENLIIKKITKEEILICGNITKLELENNEE